MMKLYALVLIILFAGIAKGDETPEPTNSPTPTPSTSPSPSPSPCPSPSPSPSPTPSASPAPTGNCPADCDVCDECVCEDCYCGACAQCADCPEYDSCCPEETCETLECCDTCEEYNGENLQEECCDNCPASTEIYTASDGLDHSFVLVCKEGSSRLSFTEGTLTIYSQYDSEVAVLTGSLVYSSGPTCLAGAAFDVQVVFSQVSADDVEIKLENGATPDDWRYYELIEGSATQTDCVDDCVVYTIETDPNPDGKPWGLQVGTSASLKNNEDFGASIWITFTSPTGEVFSGDINIKLDTVCPQ